MTQGEIIEISPSYLRKNKIEDPFFLRACALPNIVKRGLKKKESIVLLKDHNKRKGEVFIPQRGNQKLVVRLSNHGFLPEG